MEITCIQCKETKREYQFSISSSLIPVPENKICNRCLNSPYKEKEYECIICKKKKKGSKFTYLMTLGKKECICHWCKSKKNGYVQPKYQGKPHSDNAEERVRECLKCEKKFRSIDKFNRVCDHCKKGGMKDLEQWERE